MQRNIQGLQAGNEADLARRTASCERADDRKYGWGPIGNLCFTTQHLDRSLRSYVLPALTVEEYPVDSLICLEGLTAEVFTELFAEVMSQPEVFTNEATAQGNKGKL